MLIGVLGPFALVSSQTEQQALESVREEITALEARIARDQSRMDEDRQALRAVEREIAAAHDALDQVRADRAIEQARLDQLHRETARAQAELATQQTSLARQVRMSYMTGREELLKLVLNQEDPAAIGRMIAYYDFFNRYRSGRIDVVATELTRLAELVRATRASEARLSGLAEQREIELAALERARTQRDTTVTAVAARLAESGRTLDALRSDEARLGELVAELGEILAAFPTGAEAPFASLRGQLAWPARGQIRDDYGQPRNGGPLRWNGVVIEVPPEDEVRAIYHGHVAFSDWLPGLGLLTIVDHGDGFLSLYGYNEVLYKASGEWVTPGEVLGLASPTDGRGGLYFELRHDGDPVDPHDWMQGQPQSP